MIGSVFATPAVVKALQLALDLILHDHPMFTPESIVGGVVAIIRDALAATPPEPTSADSTVDPVGLRAALERLLNQHTDETLHDHEDCTPAECAVAGARAALAASSEGGSDSTEHEWTDAQDDEEGWLCSACGERRYPGDPTAHAASPGASAAPLDVACGCGHPKADHFPACLASVEDKPWTDFAAPFDVVTGRWGHNYVCSCPAFGSPGGEALGKRREKNRRARLAAAPSSSGAPDAADPNGDPECADCGHKRHSHGDEGGCYVCDAGVCPVFSEVSAAEGTEP